MAGSSRPIRLGGPIFLRSEDPRELAREHRRLGYSAAYCPMAKVDDTARVAEIQKAFAAENVVIAEVGAWKNMLDPDGETRRANQRYVIERMALAEAVGARCCVDIAGSYNPKYWYGPNPKNLSSGIPRCNGRELPPHHRRSQAQANQVHHRDDGVEHP